MAHGADVTPPPRAFIVPSHILLDIPPTQEAPSDSSSTSTMVVHRSFLSSSSAPSSVPSASTALDAQGKLEISTSGPMNRYEVDSSIVPDEPLPDKRPRFKRIFSLPAFSPHRRLIFVIGLLNIIVLTVACHGRWWNRPSALALCILVNIAVAILVRQQRFINFIFWLVTAGRTKLPLPTRWALAKIYHFGGLHSGCAVAATVWTALFGAAILRLRLVTVEENGVVVPTPSIAILVMTGVILVLLGIIVLLALPPLRMHFHNSFEASHRFLGWTLLLLVWVHAVLLAQDYKPNDVTLTTAFFSSAPPYLLFLITLSVVSPWLDLRKVRVMITKPSGHAIIVKFPDRRRAVFPGSSSSISVDPLFEWHSFANIPTPGEPGFRLIISRAGDWTSRIIDSPPTNFWIRGIPTAGVANIETLFERVVYVCTGSGIGPVLPHLLAKRVPSTLFWSTRSPEMTYGSALLREILNAAPDAVVHNTAVLGKPDMVMRSYALVQRTGAEAVICISNQKLTRKVVYGMETRGIPAFGAIWDS